MKKSKSKVPTMYDVAKLAGVSQPTVSRILNKNETNVPIREETRQRVYEAIQKLGYRPNVIARSLRTQRTQMIALLVADISNGYYHPIARAIQDIARQHDYEVLISNSDHLYANERHFCEVVSQRAIEGLILVPLHLTLEDIDRLMSKTHAPVAILGQHIEHPNVDVVYVEDEKAVYEATRWLVLERGYTNFGFIGVSDDLPPGPRRRRGFQRAISELGLTVDPRFMLEGDFTMDSGAEAVQKLVQIGEMPRALVVLNDLMAIGVILALQEAGYRVPDDVAVIGFDDIPEARIVRPALTTIAQHPRDIGLKLITALFERIENPSIVGRRQFESSYTLVERQST